MGDTSCSFVGLGQTDAPDLFPIRAIRPIRPIRVLRLLALGKQCNVRIWEYENEKMREMGK